jgi:hypothetical protein
LPRTLRGPTHCLLGTNKIRITWFPGRFLMLRTHR